MRPPSIGAPMYPAVSIAYPRHMYQPFGSGVAQPRRITTNENAMTNRLTAHTDQASQAAARGVISPIPRLRSFVPSVTTPHSTALLSPERYDKRYEDRFLSRGVRPSKTYPLMSKRCMLVSSISGAVFSRGVCAPGNATAHFRALAVRVRLG